MPQEVGRRDAQMEEDRFAVSGLLCNARGSFGMAALPVAPAMVNDKLVVTDQEGLGH